MNTPIKSGRTGSLYPPRTSSKGKNHPIRVLLIEDNPGDARLIQEMLKDASNTNLRFEHATSLREGLKYLGDPEKPLDAVLLDLGLPDSQGFETFTRFHEEAESFTVIVLSGLNDVDLALHAVRNGAQDYLVKGQITGEVLLRSIHHAIERDEAERLLRESQERYQTLVDMMPDSIIVHTQGEMKFVNPAAIKLMGAEKPKDLIGKQFMDFVHQDYKEAVLERIRRSQVEGKSLPPLEEKLFRLDGKVIEVEVTGTPLIFEDQPASQLILRDITDRKQHERELEAVASVSSKLRMANNLDEMLPIVLDEAIAAVSASEGTITLSNQAGDHEIVIGRGPRALPVGKVIPNGQGLTSEVVKTGVPYVNNRFRTQPDPRTVKLSDIEPTEALAIIPITAENHVIGTLGLGRASAFENSDIVILTAILDIGGSALHRAELFEQTQQRLRRLRSLREIDTAIASSFDLGLTLEVVVTQAINELRADASCVLLLNEEQVLKFGAGKGFKTNLAKTADIKIGQGLAGRVAKERTFIEAPVIADALPPAELKTMVTEEGFVSYYAAPLIAKGKVIGVLETYQRSPVNRNEEWKDFLNTLAGQAAIAIDNATLFEDLQRSNQDLRKAYDRTIEGWAHALSLRDMETVDHSRRVTEMTVKLARALGMSDDQLVQVRRGALLHDIGKMSIADHILRKTGPLDETEWEQMRKHPDYARQMLAPIEFLHPAMAIPIGHHEKWDGTGYPQGLKGKQIPLEARIFAIVDVWDALTSDRPYRQAWPEEKVRQYLLEQSGKHFDPKVVEAFFQYILTDKK
jgi:PAS domain S-box-containing protein/putative nucleotidyltransferase with HDIG domain